MRILHASSLDGQMLLWGERSVEREEAKTPRRGRRSSSPAGWLSCDAGEEALRTALAEAGVEAPGAFRAAVLWAPTAGGRPAASSPLIAALPDVGAAAALHPWRVTALPLGVEQAVVLLCACLGRDTLCPGVVVGASLAYWTSAMRFAGALVSRQQFLPGVRRTREGWRALWEPLLAGPEADRAAALARAMPDACRALSDGADAPPDAPAPRVLSGFLSDLCDYLVRLAAGDASPATSGRRPRAARRPAFDSLHDQWLYALRAPDPRMTGEDRDLAAFAAKIREWRRPLSLSLAAPFRLCFRLEEPALAGEDAGAPGEAWHVRYLLQSAEDPSLLIPAEQAWAARGRVAALLKREGFAPREYLLGALGQASKVCPGVEESLRSAAPGGYPLDTAGAHAFLTEQAWLLEQAGFGVLLPAWWTRKGTKLRLSARAAVRPPKLQASAGLSLDTIVQFDWEVALGGEKLTRAELEELARHKAALVRFRGQWVQLDAREIEAALAFWKQRGAQTATVREVVRMAVGAEDGPGGLPLDGVAASGPVQELLARMEGEAALEETPPPDGFRGTLRPYQLRGYSWLSFLGRWGLGACLADDMGLGKTPQTLASIRRRREEGEQGPVLIVCPTSVVGNWQREAGRFTPDLPVLVHHGLARSRGDAFRRQAERHAVVLSSYALLHRDFEILKEVAWSGVVLDEAQNIKNPETKQSRAARALPARWRVALTGTPVENHVGDLWALMEFLNPGLLGSQAEFRRAFFLPIQANRDPESAARLKRITGPFLLRRLKTDRAILTDLPEKMEMKVFCTLTREQATLYEAVVKEAEEQIEAAEGIQRKGVVLATLSRLKQVCNHPAQFLGDNSAIAGRSGKLARLTEMLEEALEEGDRALIFTQFAEMGEILRRHLQEHFGRETLFLHGGVPKKERDRVVERFQSPEGGPPLFVLSLKAGGVGINLTAASHVFHFDRWWNPAVENQATDRAFRIGQKRNVQVHKFLCAGTLEEKIDAMIESKRQVAADVVGTGEGWIANMSTAELKALLALGRDAAGD